MPECCRLVRQSTEELAAIFFSRNWRAHIFTQMWTEQEQNRAVSVIFHYPLAHGTSNVSNGGGVMRTAWGREYYDSKPRLLVNRSVTKYPFPVALLLILLGVQFSSGQNFSVRNPKGLNFPEAEANRIYQSAADAIQKEFHQSEAVRPQFTLMLGADKNHLEGTELRLIKWDSSVFAQGVVLLSFQQLMSRDRTIRLVQRTISQANALITPGEVRAAPRTPVMPAVPSSTESIVEQLRQQTRPILQPR